MRYFGLALAGMLAACGGGDAPSSDTETVTLDNTVIETVMIDPGDVPIRFAESEEELEEFRATNVVDQLNMIDTTAKKERNNLSSIFNQLLLVS